LIAIIALILLAPYLYYKGKSKLVLFTRSIKAKRVYK
jgi:hypothetical protein